MDFLVKREKNLKKWKISELFWLNFQNTYKFEFYGDFGELWDLLFSYKIINIFEV